MISFGYQHDLQHLIESIVKNLSSMIKQRNKNLDSEKRPKIIQVSYPIKCHVQTIVTAPTLIQIKFSHDPPVNRAEELKSDSRFNRTRGLQESCIDPFIGFLRKFSSKTAQGWMEGQRSNDKQMDFSPLSPDVLSSLMARWGCTHNVLKCAQLGKGNLSHCIP